MNQEKTGNKLKKYRIQAGYSQKELADMFSLSRSLISMYEAGKRMPSPPVMKKYSKLFNRSVDDIFFR